MFSLEKMKSKIVLVLAVTFSFVVANPVLIETDVDENSLLSDIEDSNPNQDVTPSNSQIEQNNSETIENANSVIVEDGLNSAQTVEIDIEGTQQHPEQLLDFQETIDNQLPLQDANINQLNLQENIDIEHEFELVKEGDYYYNDVIYKDPNEVMETAAGFVPVPIFRKRQKQPTHKQFSTRRYYRRPYASRRNYFYPYYAFYRPSSLSYSYYY